VETPQINLRVRKNPSLPEIAPRTENSHFGAAKEQSSFTAMAVAMML
jgi:hypothetical protein